MWYFILIVFLITFVLNLSINLIAKKLSIYDFMINIQEKEFFVNARFIVILLIIIMVILFECIGYPQNELFFLIFIGFIIVFLFISNKVVKFLSAINESHIISKRYEKNKILNNLEKMEVIEFEKILIKHILPSLGFKGINDISKNDDYMGVITAYKNGNSYIILCNNINKKIGIREIESAIAVKKHYICDKAMIVTKIGYTNNANLLAINNSIEILDNNNIINMINFYYSFDNNDEK